MEGLVVAIAVAVAVRVVANCIFVSCGGCRGRSFRRFGVRGSGRRACYCGWRGRCAAHGGGLELWWLQLQLQLLRIVVLFVIDCDCVNLAVDAMRCCHPHSSAHDFTVVTRRLYVP